MAEIFNITLNANNLNEFTDTVTDGGDLFATTPGLASTAAKLGILIDDGTEIYGYKDFSNPSADYRNRFYVHPSTLTMASGDRFTIYQLGLTSVAVFDLCYDGSSYELRYAIYDDGGYVGAATFDISDAEHYVEFYVERATNNSSADGQYRLWIDGTLRDTTSNRDNYDRWTNITGFYAGMCGGRDAGTSGTFYMDEFQANDDGSEIGPALACGNWQESHPIASYPNDAIMSHDYIYFVPVDYNDFSGDYWADKIRSHLDTSATDVKFALYADSAGVPGDLIYGGGAQGISIQAYNELDIPDHQMTDGNRYWIAIAVSAAASFRAATSAPAGTTEPKYRSRSYTYENLWPDPAGTTTPAETHYGYAAIYVACSAGTLIPVMVYDYRRRRI